MDKTTKKKIIIISAIDLLLAVLFELSIFPYYTYIISSLFIGFEYIIALICCGIINNFLIKDTTLWRHIKFFIPFSIGIAILFRIVYFYFCFFSHYCNTEFLIHDTAKFATIFFIGTLLGAVLKRLMGKMDAQVREKMTIRLIVYSIVILIAFILGRFTWILYADQHPDQALKAHIFTLKLQGIEYCETPEEAIQRYAQALIDGDRDEALEYVYKPKYDLHRWKADKRMLYEDYTNEELKKRGERILNGYMEKKYAETAEWAVIYIDGIESRPTIRITRSWNDGWKIE